jgi:2,5-diamino-6-(ribosylamino)-4(3H)-pyrimidinone 5'-phosphate reductase
VTARWRLPAGVLAEYERTARTFDADAWMVGRISMAPYAGKARVPTRKLRRRQRMPRNDFLARPHAESYAIALDLSGKLAWTSSSIGEDHVVAVLGERVSDAYLTFLRSKGVSYIFGGRTHVNLERTLHKLGHELGVRKLLLEGGGKINGSFLAANLVDELSLLVAPIADGSMGTPSLFDVAEGKGPARRLKLVSVERRKGDLLWVRYLAKR